MVGIHSKASPHLSTIIMDWLQFGALLLAGTFTGVVNSLAGAASLVSFPVLLALGLPPSVAHATNFVSLTPGNAAAAWAYRKDLRRLLKPVLIAVVVTGLGTTVGANLLLASGDRVFMGLVPYLILFAVLVYWFGGRLQMDTGSAYDASKVVLSLPIVLALLAMSVYGGYFGAGIGILALAIMRMAGFTDFHDANAIKNLLMSSISLFAVIWFHNGQLISWPHAAVVASGSLIGGILGIRYARNIPQQWLHRFIISFGIGLAVYYGLA